MTLIKANLGSVSHGSLRAADMLRAFAETLVDLKHPDFDPGDAIEAAIKLETGDATWQEQHDAIETLTDLTQKLGEHAPPYTRFGAHEGDSSDFGFWPNHEKIQEDIKGWRLIEHSRIPQRGTNPQYSYFGSLEEGNFKLLYRLTGAVIWEQ